MDANIRPWASLTTEEADNLGCLHAKDGINCNPFDPASNQHGWYEAAFHYEMQSWVPQHGSGL